MSDDVRVSLATAKDASEADTNLGTVYSCGAVNKDEPRSYLDWHRWAEQMSKTHIQRQCATCGLWHVWERRSEVVAYPPKS